MVSPGHTRNPLILGVDLGTSSLKAPVIDARGALVASAMRAHPTASAFTPPPPPSPPACAPPTPPSPHTPDAPSCHQSAWALTDLPNVHAPAGSRKRNSPGCVVPRISKRTT